MYKLDKLLEDKDADLTSPDVLRCSKKVDWLINRYLDREKRKNED